MKKQITGRKNLPFWGLRTVHKGTATKPCAARKQAMKTSACVIVKPKGVQA